MGSSALKHWLRGICGTRKRYCVDCKNRWAEQDRSYTIEIPRYVVIGAAVTVVVAAVGSWAFMLAVSRSSSGDYASERREGAPVQFASVGGVGARGTSGGGYSAGAEPHSSKAASESWFSKLMHPFPSDSDRSEIHFVQAKDGESKLGSRSDQLGLLNSMLKMMSQRQAEEQANQLMKMDKRELWRQYGHYFSSKEQAKSYYEQYQKDPKAFIKKNAKDAP